MKAKHLLQLWLFTIPLGTVWIMQSNFLGGAKWEYGTLVWYASEGLLWLTAVVWWWQKPRQAGFWRGLVSVPDLVWGVVLIYICASLWWSVNADLTAQSARFVVDGLLAFWLIRQADTEEVKPAWWLGLGLSLAALLGVAQFVTQATWASVWLGLGSHSVAAPGTSVVVTAAGARWLRAYGPFAHPNIFGGYLVLALVAWSTIKPTSKLLGKIWYWAAWVFLVAALYMTFSRSAWVSAALIGIVAAVRHTRRDLIAVAAAFVVILSLASPSLVFTRVAITSAHETQSLTERATGLATAKKLWQSHPWRGVGLGAYTAAAAVNAPGQPGWAYQPVHMVWWLLLVELGVLGVGLIVVAVGTIIIRWYRDPQTHFDWPLMYVGVGILVIGSLDHYLVSLYSGYILLGASWGLAMHK